MRILAALMLLLGGSALGQEGEWAPLPQQERAPEPTPPPPPPPTIDPPPSPPPRPVQQQPGSLPPAAPPPGRPTIAPAPVVVEEQGFRFAPTMHVLLFSWGPGLRPADEVAFAPSIRAGLRFAAFPRPAERYNPNLGVSLEFGLEGARNSAANQVELGFGITAKGGFSPVSPRGLFFPFADIYLLATLGFFPGQPGGTAVVTKLGFGLNVNAAAIAPGGRGSWGNLGGGNWGAGAYVLLVALFIVLPNLEFVVTLPSAINPVPLGEIRFGFGF